MHPSAHIPPDVRIEYLLIGTLFGVLIVCAIRLIVFRFVGV